MTPGEWLYFPVPKDAPLAALTVVIDGVAYPAFRENDQALIRCPALPGVHRVEVQADGRQVHTAVLRIN